MRRSDGRGGRTSAAQPAPVSGADCAAARGEHAPGLEQRLDATPRGSFARQPQSEDGRLGPADGAGAGPEHPAGRAASMPLLPPGAARWRQPVAGRVAVRARYAAPRVRARAFASRVGATSGQCTLTAWCDVRVKQMRLRPTCRRTTFRCLARICEDRRDRPWTRAVQKPRLSDSPCTDRPRRCHHQSAPLGIRRRFRPAMRRCPNAVPSS